MHRPARIATLTTRRKVNVDARGLGLLLLLRLTHPWA
jgi:hypothetical protein